MNKYFAIDDSMSPELLKDFYSLVNSLSEGDVLNILLNSGGGKIYVAEAISEAINREPHKFTITGTEYLFSSAFNLFFDSHCERKLMYNTIGMAHQGRKEMTLNSRGHLYYDGERFERSQSENDLIHSIKRLINLGVDDKKIKKFKTTEDIFFTHIEMVNMLEKSIELNERREATQPARSKSEGESGENGGGYEKNFIADISI